MLDGNLASSTDAYVNNQRSEQLFENDLDEVRRRRDGFFCRLLPAQWAVAIILALTISPHTWTGRHATTHIHVFYAIFLGAVLTIPGVIAAQRRPGWVGTRYIITASQMLWSTLFIHLTGGRIETHFHVFVSLAFLSFYRDAGIIITATCVVLFDHLFRGYFYPISVYGVSSPEWWRLLEHATWVVFETGVLIQGVFETRREMHVSATRQSQIEAVALDVESIVLKRTEELKTSEKQYRDLVERIQAVMCTWSLETGHFTYVAPQAETLLGFPTSEWLLDGFLKEKAHADDLSKAVKAFSTQGMGTLEVRLRNKSGSWVWTLIHFRTVGQSVNAVLFDNTEKRRTEHELGQAQKLESVGRLAAGVAHEINTPVQFVTDSVTYLRDAFDSLLKLVEQYRATLKAQPLPEVVTTAITNAEEEADLDYARDRVPKALERALDGLSRVAKLVKSMKAFAHPDQADKVMADINQIVATTLTIANNEYKYVAEVQTHYGNIPMIPGHVGELGQAFLNIIVNAAHAIADATPKGGSKGTITISTVERNDNIVVLIKDTGGGIPDSIRERVFDPFFTTKEVGRGTGQGLPISRSIVVEKHGGSLTFESEMGVGTTFVISLPRHGSTRDGRAVS